MKKAKVGTKKAVKACAGCGAKIPAGKGAMSKGKAYCAACK